MVLQCTNTVGDDVIVKMLSALNVLLQHCYSHILEKHCLVILTVK